jgi:hypothetical protein
MAPPRYRLVIEGELGPRYANAFDGMTLRTRDGQTEITGPIIDQSRLLGLLERVAGLGLTLYSLTPVGAENAVTEVRAQTQPAGVNDHSPGINSKGP